MEYFILLTFLLITMNPKLPEMTKAPRNTIRFISKTSSVNFEFVTFLT